MADRKDQTRAEGEDPFLARWSRRKQAARETEPGAPAERPSEHAGPAARAERATHAPDEPPCDEAAPDEASRDDEAPVDEASLSPPETLGPDSDFSAYLSKRVSSGLRRAALRRLFSLPGFNVRDGLDDYDEDYTQFASLGDTVTADMKYHEERLRAGRAAEEQEEEAAEEAGEADAPPEAGEEGTAPADRPTRSARARSGATPEPDDPDDDDDA